MEQSIDLGSGAKVNLIGQSCESDIEQEIMEEDLEEYYEAKDKMR